MAVLFVIRNESDKLIQQLAGLQYIVDTNRDVFNEYSVTMDFIAFKMDIVQSLIEELQSWETLGNQSKCDSAANSAQFFLEQARALMDQVLDEQCEEVWLASQSKLRFTSHASSNYEYVLSNNTTSHPSCLAA